jgi:O-antigen ligase
VKTPLLVATRNDAVGDPQSESVLGAIVLYGVVGLLLFGPLAFGAVEAWSIFVLEAGAALLFVLWAWWQIASGELRIKSSPLFPPMLVFAALIVLQLALGRSSYRYQSLSQARLYCAYGLLCFLVVQCLRRTSQVKALAQFISAYGFALASFAMIQGMDPNGKLYWLRKPSEGGWIYGPYVNHNHYAGLMEMLLPIPLVISLLHSVPGPRRALAGVAAAVMASTIFLSGSRGGMLAFVVQIVVLSAILLKRRKGGNMVLAFGAFLALVAGLLVWLGGSDLTDRVASIHTESSAELSGGLRLAIDRDALKMVARKPLLGWGLGVFPTVYPQYRSFYTDFFVNEAHDDYAQLLVEMGGLGFLTMLWFISVAYYRAAEKLDSWTKDANGAIAMAAMLGMTGILAHSLTDFNLQIPANAALFYVLCAVAAMDPRFGGFGRLRFRRPRPENEGQLSA